MDVHPDRYDFDFDFEELKAHEGYKRPDDFLVRVLPPDAGGALPGDTKEKLWYEYSSPFADDWNQQNTQVQLLLEEESLRQSLEEREKRRQELEVDMHRRHLVESEGQHQEKSLSKRRRQRQDWDLQRKEELQLQLQLEEEVVRLSLEERQRQHLEVHEESRLDAILRQRLDEIQRQLQRLEERQRQRLGERQQRRLEDEWPRLRLELWANSSTTECWGSDGETTAYSPSSSSLARDTAEEHQFHVEEHQFYVEEHQVHVQMCEYDGANIPRYRLFKSEANTKELLLGFPLKIPYYIYAGRCNLNLEGYELRYADLFPNFYKWSCSWVRPTTYEGDDQFVDFWSELMGEVEYSNTKDRVLAKAIAIANRSFPKMLYFQIEMAVLDCMMLLEHREKMAQTCDLYGYIASEICFKDKKYESVLERIKNGHEVLRYKLTELGSDANEEDAWEMREFVYHLVRSTPIELPYATRFDAEYKKWVYKQIKLQSRLDFHLYVNYLVRKMNMAQDLDLAPEDTS